MMFVFRQICAFVGCALTLASSPVAAVAILWRLSKNLRARLGLGRHHPEKVYALSTVYGKLHFRDNFGDITNLVNLLYRRVYRVEKLACDGVILDVGANIGLAAVWFAHHNPGRAIHCFEPLPGNAALIRLNCPGAVVENLALGATRGRLTLRVDPDEVMASRIPNRWATVEREFEVISLDEYAAKRRLGEIALIKMDAEGMEADILRGGRETLRRTDQVVMETHGRLTHQQVLGLLLEAGLEVDDESFNGATGMVFARRPQTANRVDRRLAVNEVR